LKILSALIVALLLAVFMLMSEDETLPSEERINVVFALSSEQMPDRILIGENTLEQIGADVWRINNKFNIDPDMLESLFAVLGKIEIKRPVPSGLRDKVAQAFVNNHVEVKAFMQNVPLRSFILTEFEGETYAMTKDKNAAYAVFIPGFPVELFKIFLIDENEWRDKRIFKTNSRTVKSFESFESKKGNKVLSVRFETVAADSGYFVIEGIEKADQNKVVKFLNSLEKIKVAGFIDESKAKEAIVAAQPIANFSVEDIEPTRNASLKFYKFEESFIGHSLLDNQYFVIEEKMLGRLFALPSDFALKKNSAKN
jgi:hypothetical protein